MGVENKMYVLLALGALLYFLFKNPMSLDFATAVTSDFLIESLEKGEVAETWLRLVNKNVGDDENKATDVKKYVHVRLRNAEEYSCLSNEEF